MLAINPIFLSQFARVTTEGYDVLDTPYPKIIHPEQPSVIHTISMVEIKRVRVLAVTTQPIIIKREISIGLSNQRKKLKQLLNFIYDGITVTSDLLELSQQEFASLLESATKSGYIRGASITKPKCTP